MGASSPLMPLGCFAVLHVDLIEPETWHVNSPDIGALDFTV